jgi:2'-5' RNA ligase
MLRLFFALQPGLEQNAGLVEQVAPLVLQLEAQTVPAENLHATLCFIGAVAEERLPSLKEVAAGIRGQQSTLNFDAFEYWEKPKIICATANDESASLPARRLAEEIAAALIDTGFSPDFKPFRAHLTLARKVLAVNAAKCEWPRALASPVRVHCDRFVLMRSDHGESRSIYSVVESWPLYGNEPR